jgi:hypothetical protein
MNVLKLFTDTDGIETCSETIKLVFAASHLACRTKDWFARSLLQTVVSLSQHYKNPTKPVGLL